MYKNVWKRLMMKTMQRNIVWDETETRSERERKKLLSRHFFPSDTFACCYKWWSLSKCVKEFFIPLTVERGGWCDLSQFDSRVPLNRFYRVTYARESSPTPLVCVCLRLFSLLFPHLLFLIFTILLTWIFEKNVQCFIHCGRQQETGFYSWRTWTN